MDMFYIPALASFSGSASGTLASILTNWVTQRRKDRVRHTLRAAFQREELYKSFIEAAEKAGRLILDTYLSPNRTFVDLPELINEMDPLRDFSEVCRRELQGT